MHFSDHFVNLSHGNIILFEKWKCSYDSITKSLANALGLEESAVGIGATTLEGLGFVGREEGICVSATATVVKM